MPSSDLFTLERADSAKKGHRRRVSLIPNCRTCALFRRDSRVSQPVVEPGSSWTLNSSPRRFPTHSAKDQIEKNCAQLHRKMCPACPSETVHFSEL
ncbi:unnamed protein product [Protopolystoma xenopodis]|uniref:Uncharacterized protein n=1 Tax=Protopolystoma xenopodis TaxID=117903 RepID=A0A448X2R5_9PLAT|nr:unnamed protein product [Protopolystoma xenopodis]